MTKFLNLWMRKIHRWLSVPTFLSIPLMVFARFTDNAFFTIPAPFEKGQQILILFLALSGSYLYFIPYFIKARRKRKRSSGERR
jgi:hypothetical protein